MSGVTQLRHLKDAPPVSQTALYPFRFAPIYQYRLWGGRRLAGLLTAPLPDGPIGEAWVLSDRETIRAVSRMDRSKGGPSVNCWHSFPIR